MHQPTIEGRHAIPDYSAHLLGRLADFLLRPRSPFWSGRLGLAFSILTTCAIAAFWENSLNRYAFVGAHGWAGWVTLGLQAGLAFTLVADVIVNDLASARYHINWARRNRWLVLLALSGLSALMLFVNSHDDLLETLMLRFAVEMVVAFSLSLFDLMERIRDDRLARLGRRCTDRKDDQ